LLPLRAFLGFTFCFAGLQKLANLGSSDAADLASIQSQLAGAARRSPVRALISPLAHVAARRLRGHPPGSPGWAVRACASARRPPDRSGVGNQVPAGLGHRH